MVTVKICKVCNNEFVANSNRQLVCDDCKAKAKAVKTKICEYCGETFIPKHGLNKYCSDKCSREAKLAYDRAKSIELKKERYNKSAKILSTCFKYAKFKSKKVLDNSFNCVYKYIDENTNEVYIGITKNLARRDWEHKYYNNKFFKRAELFIIAENLSNSAMKFLEEFFYIKYKNDGYNMVNLKHPNYKYFKKHENKLETCNVIERCLA
jgi:hypothetical protein